MLASSAFRSILRLTPPKMLSHRIEKPTGAVKVALINCLMVLPLEIFAMNIPTKGDQAIHQQK